PPKVEIQTEDAISFEINIPQFKGDCSFITETPFNKEEVVCLMSVYSKFKDLLEFISNREIKHKIPSVLNEIISRGSLETKDQMAILNEMLKEVLEKSEESPDFLLRFNIIFQNVINTVERVGVMAQSYLGLLRNNVNQPVVKVPVKLKTVFEQALLMLPTDVDKEKFSIYIDDSIVIKIDEDKLRYAISNILSYGNRKSDHITIYTEYSHQGDDVVISIVLSGVNLDEDEILTLDENKLKNSIELSSAIEYVKNIFNGRFWIDNSPSKGTTLSISLPVE
ncbi:MAG: hypothetical protein ACOCV8_04670, partial [Spirochaetota bacterium]